MNELDYAKMIEIPVSTADIVTVGKQRKFRRKREEKLKDKLISAVNDSAAEAERAKEAAGEECPYADKVEITTLKEERKKNRKRLSVDIVGVQTAAVILLALFVALTSVLWRESGINMLVRSVFSSEKTEEDVVYTRFSPELPAAEKISLEAGVITVSGGGSVYAMCDGVVTNVAENADKLDITIRYSPSFTAVISGADYAYYGMGESVYKALPVCYAGGDVKVRLYNSGELLTDYVLDGGKIVWQS